MHAYVHVRKCKGFFKRERNLFLPVFVLLVALPGMLLPLPFASGQGVMYSGVTGSSTVSLCDWHSSWPTLFLTGQKGRGEEQKLGIAGFKYAPQYRSIKNEVKEGFPPQLYFPSFSHLGQLRGGGGAHLAVRARQPPPPLSPP